MQPIRLRPWYDHEAVRAQHEAEQAARRAEEEQENNEGPAGETPNPHDPNAENDNGINTEDNQAPE